MGSLTHGLLGLCGGVALIVAGLRSTDTNIGIGLVGLQNCVSLMADSLLRSTYEVSPVEMFVGERNHPVLSENGS